MSFTVNEKILVSSTNKIVYSLSETVYRSLTYTMNRRQPNMDPWGIPLIMFLITELVLENDTY